MINRDQLRWLSTRYKIIYSGNFFLKKPALFLLQSDIITKQYVGTEHTDMEIWVDYTTVKFSFTGAIHVIRRFFRTVVHAQAGHVQFR